MFFKRHRFQRIGRVDRHHQAFRTFPAQVQHQAPAGGIGDGDTVISPFFTRDQVPRQEETRSSSSTERSALSSGRAIHLPHASGRGKEEISHVPSSFRRSVEELTWKKRFNSGGRKTASPWEMVPPHTFRKGPAHPAPESTGKLFDTPSGGTPAPPRPAGKGTPGQTPTGPAAFSTTHKRRPAPPHCPRNPEPPGTGKEGQGIRQHGKSMRKIIPHRFSRISGT